MATIKLMKVNIGADKYYSVFKSGETLITEEITASAFTNTITSVPSKTGATWVSSSQNISFDTPSGNLSDNQYATQTNGYHWVKIPGYSVIKVFPEHIKNNTLSQAGIDYIKFWAEEI